MLYNFWLQSIPGLKLVSNKSFFHKLLIPHGLDVRPCEAIWLFHNFLSEFLRPGIVDSTVHRWLCEYLNFLIFKTNFVFSKHSSNENGCYSIVVGFKRKLWLHDTASIFRISVRSWQWVQFAPAISIFGKVLPTYDKSGNFFNKIFTFRLNSSRQFQKWLQSLNRVGILNRKQIQIRSLWNIQIQTVMLCKMSQKGGESVKLCRKNYKSQ